MFNTQTEIEMNTELFIHNLKGGKDRKQMISAIKDIFYGDKDILADGWENMPTEDILELYNLFVLEAAE